MLTACSVNLVNNNKPDGMFYSANDCEFKCRGKAFANEGFRIIY